MKKAKLLHVVNYMPEKTVNNEALLQQILKEDPESIKKDKLLDHAFFKGVVERRFASPDYSSAELGEQVANKILRESNINASEIDLIICSCVFSDTYWPGIVTDVQRRIGALKASIMNIDTSCCSFITGLNIAQAYIQSGQADKVLVITVTNFISRLTEFQKSPRSFVLGDGATAALIIADEKENSIVASYERSFGENYGLMRFEPDIVDEAYLNYWERGCGPITVNFDKASLDKIRQNALDIVPKMVRGCLKKANMQAQDINWLITHQPNQYFIDYWRKDLGIETNRAHDTLAKYGNLFQGSISVTLADGIENNIFKKQSIIVLGTFSNGGDFGASLILRL